MTGYLTRDMVVSNLTLALFADMGRYVVNWSMGEKLLFRSNAGCNFLNKSSCIGDHPEYCCIHSTEGSYRGTFDRYSVGVCGNYEIFDNSASIMEIYSDTWPSSATNSDYRINDNNFDINQNEDFE